MIAVDLLAPIALTQALLPRMVQAGGGRIVAMSSVAGIVGAPLRSAYSAAKHGLIGYHDAVRAENEHLGIQVHVLAPGSVRTNVSRNALVADGSTRGTSDAAIEAGISPAESAAAILAAIEAGTRELVLATGMEHDIVVLRRRDPEALFDQMSMLVRAGYAQTMATHETLASACREAVRRPRPGARVRSVSASRSPEAPGAQGAHLQDRGSN